MTHSINQFTQPTAGQARRPELRPAPRRAVRAALALVGTVLLGSAMTIGPVSAASLPEHHLDYVYCKGYPDDIIVPPPVVYAMNYRPGVLDWQLVTWRTQLYKQVGAGWQTVGSPSPWRPNTLVFDKDTSSRYQFVGNIAGQSYRVARGANYRIAYQVYWLKGGTGSTVPIAASGQWWTVPVHYNDTGWGWMQFAPDLCHYPVTSGVINIS